MASNNKEKPKWLEVEVCLMNQDDQKKKIAWELAAEKVNMVTMKIKIHTGYSELALPISLVKQLKLDYVDTVQVSSSTDNNLPIDRNRPVLIYWDGQVYEVTAYSIPSFGTLLGLEPLLSMKLDFDWHNNSQKRNICSFSNRRY
jgi:hypothetical protein